MGVCGLFRNGGEPTSPVGESELLISCEFLLAQHCQARRDKIEIAVSEVSEDMQKFCVSIWVGLRTRWQIGSQRVLSLIGSAWLLTEVSSFFSESIEVWLKANSAPLIQVFSVMTFLCFFASVYSPRTVEINIPTTQTKLILKYGNLFEEKADLIIAVNEFFDGAIGPIVSSESVHGQFIAKYFNSDSSAFRRIVDPQLAGHQSTQQARAVLPDESYPLGTTISVPIGQFCAYLVALSTTDLQTHKATTTVANLWMSITNVLESVHHLSGGRPVAMPLIGNGLAGLNLHPQHVLRLVVLAIVMTSRKMQMPKKIVIVLHEDCFEQLDLAEIAKNWKS